MFAVLIAICTSLSIARADACTAKITTLKSVGSTSDGKYVVYQVDATSRSAESYSVTLQLTSSDGKTMIVDAPTVTPKAPDFTTQLRFVTEGAIAKNISLASQTFGAAQSSTPCAGSAVELSPASNGFGDDVFTDAIGRDATARAPAQPYPPMLYTDAHFIRKSVPEYPAIAQDRDEIGTAVAMVWIGTDGKLLAVRFSRETGWALLNRAVLNAVFASKFAPALLNGQPVVSEYKIIYKFVLGPYILGNYSPAANEDTQLCRVQISNADYVGFSKILNLGLYRLMATLKSPVATSADIALGTGSKNATILTWRDIIAKPSSAKDVLPVDMLYFVWRGPPIEGGWVTATRLSESNQAGDSCSPSPVDTIGPLALLGALPSPDPTATSDPSMTQRAYVATFFHRAVPTYPQAADRSYAAGRVRVIVSVSPDGRPDSADIITSSGDAALDASALQAALSSTYRLHQRLDGPDSYIYLVTYDFVPAGLWTPPHDELTYELSD
ncbi:MAG TPA: energy transducer TonB [Candidatus Eremiobacteraceae bacterium]|nr:energy transducer TonB [Candidatus Eremiobacteraceae bacterium]